MEGLVFGWRSALLVAAMAPLLPIGAGLWMAPANRSANRTLAMLLMVLAGIATPWMIGFAGFYDRWQGLSFVPFSLSLAVPPLLWLFAHALTHGHWPKAGWLHLLPAALQAALKVAQMWTGNLSAAALALDLALFASALFYGVRSLRLLARFRAFLAQERSDDRLFAARWLSRAIIAVLVLLGIAFAYKIAGSIVPLGYRGNMGQYVAVAFFALYLGVEGWRHAGLAYPTFSGVEGHADTEAGQKDWQELGLDFESRVRAGEWTRDPHLSLDSLARILGTNRTYLSRAVNEGLGRNFSGWINAIRSETVADRIDAGSAASLLDLALEAGFSSKATFNRAFRERYRTTPSAYRARIES